MIATICLLVGLIIVVPCVVSIIRTPRKIKDDKEECAATVARCGIIPTRAETRKEREFRLMEGADAQWYLERGVLYDWVFVLIFRGTPLIIGLILVLVGLFYAASFFSTNH
jgi:hypothetical protein